ncbi:cell wall-associated NlpC family hydrolase [Krasilnikovia cinnamomea]|uniref:Cell wall-associated NlpC family hydrolase n=1 Tax=Krasilnikovia cinnamomea TaxID=349313 RepID=A0A4Q7ZEF0_9ACTN|nr:NlpC/P60 family protein [Krasilnikovia cinnamomea]RZU48493.1 cell wall-associated NlpC family hydrolase [Krasilnikovia cinnamomea]
MPRYSAEQIYGFARRAGFSPDEAATMTAIALAESGGNSRAHNPHGEDSRGLWQINGRAHPSFLTKYDLYDPQDNAKAAFEVSRHGRDISPWTVTHGGLGSRYLRHKEEAQSAAIAYGDGAGRGVWTGTAGYGDRVSASTGDGPAGDNAALETLLRVAKAQIGDRYVFGAEVKLKDPNPEVFDCSEFTQWAAYQAGVRIPDGATAQYLDLKEKGLLIPVEKAKDTPGALLFSFDREPRAGDGRTPGAHVAISLGDGKIVEAANRRAGVRESTAGSRFEYAAVLPGISDGSATPLAEPTPPELGVPPLAPAEPAPLPDLGGADSDHDGLSDALERRYGLDPLRADTDADNLTDAQELVTYGTDARKADTDGDQLNDAFELAQGLDPRSPDTDHDGHLDGSLAPAQTDTDLDGLDDALERVLGLDPRLSDSDADGFSDGLEYHSGSNPLDARDNPLMRQPGELPGAEGDVPGAPPGTGQPGTGPALGQTQLLGGRTTGDPHDLP